MTSATKSLLVWCLVVVAMIGVLILTIFWYQNSQDSSQLVPSSGDGSGCTDPYYFTTHKQECAPPAGSTATTPSSLQ